MEIEVKCTCCSKGCMLKVDAENSTVTGNSCPRGLEYGMNEIELLISRDRKPGKGIGEPGGENLG